VTDAPAGTRILLTGGSGVVGTALLPRLAAADVVCLTHRSALRAEAGAPGAVELVRGDVRAERFGLSDADYRRLLGRVDVVVHAAATTDFRQERALVEATNVGGPRTVVRFADAAGVPVIHVGTAFIEQNTRNDDAAHLDYARSKERGEQVVRSAGVPYAILRPSIVVGSVGDGRISEFQAIYHVVNAVVAGLAPVIPFEAEWLVDLVSQDTVADAIVAILRGGEWGGEYWLTAGPAAPTVRECIDGIRELNRRRAGTTVPPPKYVGQDMYRRLIEPVFLPSLPAPMRRIAEGLSRYLAPYLTGTEPFQTSLPLLAERYGLTADPDPRPAFNKSLDYWWDVNKDGAKVKAGAGAGAGA
jgi:nucleoside-diphosphate-sugar epimerase